MTHFIMPQEVQDRLTQDGVIPSGLVSDIDAREVRHGKVLEVNANSTISAWLEPMPAFDDNVDYNGFHPKYPINDHVGGMVEIVNAHGIEWRMLRVIHSQPYGPVDRLLAVTYESEGIDLVVIPDRSWYSNR